MRFISATVNGQPVRENHGCGLSWIPSFLVPQERPRDDIIGKLMDHYKLDPDKAWSINRCSIPWIGGKITELEIQMKPRQAQIPGPRFVTTKAGESIRIKHPITGNEHFLTVQEIEYKELSQIHFPDDTMEYPRFFKAMTYTVEPDIDRNHISVLNCRDGDSARPKKGLSREKVSGSASSIGIIGRSDGPTAIIMGNAVPRTLHAACSAVRFEAVDHVEWRIVFREKLKEDIQVKLI